MLWVVPDREQLNLLALGDAFWIFHGTLSTPSLHPSCFTSHQRGPQPTVTSSWCPPAPGGGLCPCPGSHQGPGQCSGAAGWKMFSCESLPESQPCFWVAGWMWLTTNKTSLRGLDHWNMAYCVLLGTQRVGLTGKINIKILKIFTVLAAINMMVIKLKWFENTLQHCVVLVGLWKTLLLKEFQVRWPATPSPQAYIQ